ncbi:MAG TPA: hypothetical protein VJT71_13730 [Pyrinomonadaceae bacterium]|nr:hypothetical protein [Pyrinomonadaceae bacterium]
MSPINWTRLIIGGLIASVIAFLTDGFFHERIVAADWAAVYHGLGVTEPKHNAMGLAYFAVFELGRGFLAIILYVLMRGCCKPGPKTAAVAGILTWLAFSVTGPAQFIPLGFFSHALWIKVGAYHLATSIIAAIAGAAVYKDAGVKAN